MVFKDTVHSRPHGTVNTCIKNAHSVVALAESDLQLVLLQYNGSVLSLY